MPRRHRPPPRRPPGHYPGPVNALSTRRAPHTLGRVAEEVPPLAVEEPRDLRRRGVDARVDVAALPADVVLGVGRRGALELVVRGLACGARRRVSGGAAGFPGADAARSPRARVRAASAACAAALASAARCSRDGRGTGTSTSEPLTVGLSDKPSRPRSLGGRASPTRGGGSVDAGGADASATGPASCGSKHDTCAGNDRWSRSGETSNLSLSVASKSSRLISGRIGVSRRGLDSQRCVTTASTRAR